MIRFIDKNLYSIQYENLNKKDLLEFFLSGRQNETVYISDIYGKYKGKIDYDLLIRCTDVYEALLEDHVILDKDIWVNARYYFSHYKYKYQEHVLLPVLNKVGQLICFAYEDSEANREMRMLRELLETPDALQFSDIYPEYQFVKIYEFNELAYFFAKYLEKLNIGVEVFGTKWQGFFESSECQVPDYECLKIYAEGVWEKKHNDDWVENLLRSVSVEFECIDKIYEANIKNGIISNGMGNVTALVDILKKADEIILYGAGREEQDAYNFLLENGIDIKCFINVGTCRHRMFGKKIISGLEARNTYKNALFIDCVSQGSAWGFGKVDYYDYIGYKRNERFFLLKDYIDISRSGLINVLKSKKVALLGDFYLCYRLRSYLNQNMVTVIGYMDPLSKNSKKEKMPFINITDIKEDTICLIAVPEFFEAGAYEKQVEEKARLIGYLTENKIDNYSDYFSYVDSCMKLEENNTFKYTKGFLKPKKIVIGSIEGYSGNAFFEGLLDWHPQILMMDVNSNLRNRLFWICIRLAMEEAENILSLFWEICKAEGVRRLDNPSIIIDDPRAFNEKLEQLLAYSDRFTSQELFVMLHIAYMYMCGKDITEEALKEMIIFWEPHCMECNMVEEFVTWLGEEKMPCDIINVVRNICMTKGTQVKNIFLREGYKDKTIARQVVLNYPSIDNKNYKWCERLVVKFEELKCNPQKVLQKICATWNLRWSDTLMITTRHGKKHFYYNGEREVSDFDLGAVYNTYEEYFSELDRFRLILINGPWQKKYGYPYVEISGFSGRELQEMFLKEFRFEKRIKFSDPKSKLEFDIRLQKQIRTDRLQKVKMIDLLMSEL